MGAAAAVVTRLGVLSELALRRPQRGGPEAPKRRFTERAVAVARPAWSAGVLYRI
jgi:hypothetical protein